MSSNSNRQLYDSLICTKVNGILGYVYTHPIMTENCIVHAKFTAKWWYWCSLESKIPQSSSWRQSTLWLPGTVESQYGIDADKCFSTCFHTSIFILWFSHFSTVHLPLEYTMINNLMHKLLFLSLQCYNAGLVRQSNQDWVKFTTLTFEKNDHLLNISAWFVHIVLSSDEVHAIVCRWSRLSMKCNCTILRNTAPLLEVSIVLPSTHVVTLHIFGTIQAWKIHNEHTIACHTKRYCPINWGFIDPITK